MKVLAICVALAVAACGSKSAPVASSSQGTKTAPASMDDPTCPLVVPGTSLTVEDTANGAALVFVTTGDALAVRARAAQLAEKYSAHNASASTFAAMFTPGATATASEVEGGARVEFAAASPDGVASLQKELHMHGGHLTSGSCEM